MNTTIGQLIQSELLKTCLEVTSKLREKDSKKNKGKKFTRSDIAEIEIALATIGYNGMQIPQWLAMFAVLHDAPELKKGSVLPDEVFMVFVLEQNASGHPFTVNVPFIGASLNPVRGLDFTGDIRYTYDMRDKPRYATDDEVKYCVKNLNDKQLNYILTKEPFKPIIASAMKRAVLVEETEAPVITDDEDNGEVTLPGGRTIIVDKE
jgi:hypothetical protein